MSDPLKLCCKIHTHAPPSPSLCVFRAAELMTRTGSVVTLEVAKQGAIYHGLATLLNQPSPMMQRGEHRHIHLQNVEMVYFSIDSFYSFTVCLLSSKHTIDIIIHIFRVPLSPLKSENTLEGFYLRIN